MAGSLTQFGEKLLLFYSVGRADLPDDDVPAPNGGLWLGLATDQSVSETGSQVGFSEASWSPVEGYPNGYARQQLEITNWTFNATAEQSRLTYNQNLVFSEYTGQNPITINHLVLFSASTGGKPIWYTQVGTSGRIVNFGDKVKIAENQLVVKLT